jgi:hypothetical protein
VRGGPSIKREGREGREGRGGDVMVFFDFDFLFLEGGLCFGVGW